MIAGQRLGLWQWMALLAIGGTIIMTAGGRAVNLFIGAVFLVGALMSFLDWASERVVERYREIRQAAAVTERVKIYEATAKLSADQVRLLEAEVPVITVMAGEPSPVKLLRVGGGEVPFQFIEQFLDMSADEWLCPVRTWAEGSKHYQWAQLLTNHLVMMGFAEASKGNRPARWIDRPRAEQWMGLE